ncbi:MAG: AI-2E family transporter, partial [Paracoccaceae bacterium]|nr:AI-2E family transporter [Paracoccaceae bacterium]
MAHPINTQAKFWGIFTAAFLIFLWFLGDMMLPYVIGAAIAYFLDPVADRLERLGLSRVLATVIISVMAALIFVVGALMIVPLLVEQTLSLFSIAPTLAGDLQAFLTKKFPSLMDSESILRKSLLSIGESIQARGGEFLNTALASVSSLVNVALLFVIVPVVSFYLLLDWDRMVQKIDDLLPRDHAPIIRRLAKEIDDTLAGFVRGMGTVSLILGSYYAVALMLVGLQFGLVVGVIAGLVTFIPYVGALVGGALAIGLGLFQFWGDWVSLGLVGG